jgi:4-hydroxybenzoate polyprenyltransferase
MASPDPALAPSALAPALVHAVRALRLHQWAKNLLVLVPLVAAHRVADAAALAQAGLAFLAFGAAASGAYVVNDLRDVEADRSHPTKRHRPIAAGALPLPLARALVPILLGAAAGLALLLPPSFGGLLAAYVVATFAYSFGLKQRPITDVLLLAVLYTLRLFAGGAATATPVSEWLASFAMFVFYSLALMKRAAELAQVDGAPAGRGYRPEERTLLTAMGTASACVSVLVLALYVSSDAVTRLYSHPRWLWLLCPAVLFWLSRLWLFAWRGEMHADPVLFALKDRESLLVAAAVLAIVALGT